MSSKATNDNYKDEREMLLAKARKVLGDCGYNTDHSCALQKGGDCPLVSSLVRSILNLQ